MILMILIPLGFMVGLCIFGNTNYEKVMEDFCNLECKNLHGTHGYCC